MDRRTSPKTAAANRRGAKTQPLKTYQTKGGAQQYGSPEDFERHSRLAFDRLIKALDPNAPPGQDLDRLSAIYNSLEAGVASAPRSYGGPLSERVEEISMEAAKNRFRRSKFKGTF